jgi:hypothetical protein
MHGLSRISRPEPARNEKKWLVSSFQFSGKSGKAIIYQLFE